jgi:CheY-like chemotaxis protein
VPDLIVTDLQMPRMDGLGLVEAVRSRHPSVPVVLVTAHRSEEIAARAAMRSGQLRAPSGISAETSPTLSARSSRWPRRIPSKSELSRASTKRGCDSRL